MKIITFAILLIIWFSLLFGINRTIIHKLSYPKEKRYLHYRLVGISFVFALVASCKLANSFIVWLTQFLSAPGIQQIIFAIIPARAIELVCILLCLLILNTAYSLMHLSAISIFKLVYSKKEDVYIDYSQCDGIRRITCFPWLIINFFYEMDNGKPKLKSSGYTLGVSIRYMKCISLAIMVLEIVAMFLSISFGLNLFGELTLTITERFYLLPAALFFLFEQMQLFLEGPETDNKGNRDTVDISEKMLGDIQALIPCYLELYKDSGAILCAEAGPKQVIRASHMHGNEAGNNQLVDCKEPGVSEILFSQLKASGVVMNFEYQNALIQLLNGDSVFVRDNIEGEFSPYYSAYISYYVSQGKCALIICPANSISVKVKNELERVLANASGMYSLCKVDSVEGLINGSEPDVIICSIEELIEMDFNLRFKELAKRIHFAVMLECSSFLEYDNLRIDLVLSKFYSIPNDMTFAFVSSYGNDRIREHIKSIFSYYCSELESFNNDYRPSNSNVMVWKGESFYNLQDSLKIGAIGSAYLGTAIPLAIVAIKNDFPSVFIIPGETTGDFYFSKNATDTNSMDLDAYFNSKVDLKNVIIPRTSDATQEEDLKVICIYDETFNLFDSLRKWFKYAGKNGSLIHVISPSYMLREYLADNYKELLNSSNIFRALYKEHLCLERSRLLHVLAMFADSDVEEKELARISRTYGWEKKYAKFTDLLFDAVKIVRSEAYDFYNYFEINDDNHLNCSKNSIEVIRHYKLTDKKLISDIVKSFEQAEVLVNTEPLCRINVLKGNLLNYYLQQQIVAFDGNYYQVTEVNNNGQLVVNPSSPNVLYDYFVFSDFEITAAERIDDCNDHHCFDFNIYEANVTRNIYGYVSSTNGNDFSSSSEYRDVVSENKTVELTNVPILELRIPKNLFENATNDEKTIKLFSVLLNGTFKTLFPNLHQNLFAVPNIRFNRDNVYKIIGHKQQANAEELLELVVGGIFDSVITHDDDKEMVSLYIIEFSCFEYGLVKALYQSITDALNIVFNYLNWYLESGKGRYLHFGMDSSIPSTFAADELRNLLKNALDVKNTTIKSNESIESFDNKDYPIYDCSFCGCRSRFAWKLYDGRLMCGSCHNQVKSQADEISTAFEEILSNIETAYDIDIDKDINICFQSKDAIERVAGKMASGRVVGFYKHYPKKQLWIERKGPTVAMQSTMAHELTHAWQYAKLDSDWKKLDEQLGKKNLSKKKTILLEGHAVFVQIDLMEKRGETRFAAWQKSEYESRDDEYGKGYRFFNDYFISKNADGGPYTPFVVMDMLVKDIINGGDTSWLDELIK